MTEEFRFKIKGMDRVMTYNEVMAAGQRVHPRCIKIIDVKRKQTWVTDYLTVKEKFG